MKRTNNKPIENKTNKPNKNEEEMLQQQVEQVLSPLLTLVDQPIVEYLAATLVEVLKKHQFVVQFQHIHDSLGDMLIRLVCVVCVVCVLFVCLFVLFVCVVCLCCLFVLFVCVVCLCCLCCLMFGDEPVDEAYCNTIYPTVMAKSIPMKKFIIFVTRFYPRFVPNTSSLLFLLHLPPLRLLVLNVHHSIPLPSP